MKKAAETTPLFRNKVPPEGKAGEVNEAGGRLLAAEAEYLRAWGWSPLVPSEPGGPVFWECRGTRLRQAQAVHFQKLEHEGMT